MHSCGVGIIDFGILKKNDELIHKEPDELLKKSQKIGDDDFYLEQLKTAYRERLQLAELDQIENKKKASDLFNTLSIAKKEYENSKEEYDDLLKKIREKEEVLNAKDAEYAILFNKLKAEFEKKNAELEEENKALRSRIEDVFKKKEVKFVEPKKKILKKKVNSIS